MLSPSRQRQAHRLTASALFEVPGAEWLEGITWAPIVSLGTRRLLNAPDSANLRGTGAWPFGNGRWRLQLGVESFNLTNHTPFA